MAKPVEHSTIGAVASTGAKAGLWALGVAALVAVLPVALGVGTYLGAAALIGGSHFIAGGLVAAVGGLATLASTAGWGALPWIAAGGGVVGAFRGASKVGAENAAYKTKVQNLTESRLHRQETQVNNAGMIGMQQGYQAGFQEGQQYVINQLRAAQEQMMMMQMAAGHGKKGFAAKLAEQREAQVGAAPQVC